jgi:two-component system nitrogen regulation response regulator NtrX
MPGRQRMQPGRAEDEAGAGGLQPTVLLVEDDTDLRFSMAAVLVREGYLVLAAGSAHDAMGLLRSPLAPIDVALLDVHLPDASGLDLCARLRELHPPVPVIVCTGEATPEEAAELLRLGAHRYLHKPVSADELLATVEASLP